MIRKEYRLLLDQENVVANVNSNILDLDIMLGFAIQALYVDNGAFAGTVKLQSSNDGTNFVDIFASDVAIDVANGNFWNYSGAYFRYVRVSLTRSAGDGDVKIIANSKGI